MKLTLKTKILFSLLGSSIVPILIICVVLGFKVKNNSLESFFETTGKELSHVEKAISIFINDIKANASMFARHPDVQAADETINSFINQTEPKATSDLPIGEVEKRILYLTRDLLKTHKSFVDVFMGTKHGGFSMASNAPLPAGYDPRVRPWYKLALNNRGTPQISKAYESTTGDVVISPVESIESGGQTVGVVGFDVTLGELTDFIQTIKLGESGYVMLVQDDGVVLADPKYSENNFKKLNELGGPFAELGSIANGEKILEIDGITYAAKVLTTNTLDWKLIGLIEKSEIMADVYSMVTIIVVIGLSIAAVFVVLGFFIANSLAKPIVTATSMIKDIAEGEGDLTKRLEVDSKDEIGELAKWFNHFLDNLQKIISDIAHHASVVDSSSGKLLGIATQVSSNASETSEKAERVANASSEMNNNMVTIASRMEGTTHNTSMVAAAVEEMASTINEIAQNSETARGISENAVRQAEGASLKVNDLGEAASAISAVTETITEISEQTNLLALNATIEAARAGEAGKGFAVVANEIKELAKQTAEATSEIKDKIDGVQGTTNETVVEIESIGKVINDINDIISTIAAAIEEQSAATSEISSNVTQASQGIEDVNINISEGTTVIAEISEEVASVNDSATEISDNSSSIEINANELKQLADELNVIIKRFKF